MRLHPFLPSSLLLFACGDPSAEPSPPVARDGGGASSIDATAGAEAGPGLDAAGLDVVGPDATSSDGALSIVDEQVGSSTISYMNPEFTPDGRYMVWFEPSGAPLPDGRLFGTMWHCGIDLQTGDLVPADGRGFAAFSTTIWGRANTGQDRDGPYYVGQLSSRDASTSPDRLVHVRPTGPRSGEVTELAAHRSEPRRRSVFPSSLTDRERNGQFVWWLENDVGFTPSAAESVELKYVALAEPMVEHVVVQQSASGPQWSPMDTTYARFVQGTSVLTLGVPAAGGVEVATFDLADPGRGLRVVTDDRRFKLDPYSFVHEGAWYFIAGINQTDQSVLYRASSAEGPFLPVETITPSDESEIAAADRCQPQSHQTFVLGGQLYSAFQIADCGSGSSFLTRRGEIWLTTLGSDPGRVTRISKTGREAKNEPEPIVGPDRAWIYYTAYPAGASPLTARYDLRRITVR